MALPTVDDPTLMNASRPYRPLLRLLALSVLCAGCAPVRFYEKEAISYRVMDLSDRPAHTHFQQKVFYSIEGAAGGIGSGAGGGCGCY
ncbi:MAG: hypothetical protein ACI841_003654 [Planctomycetota bacterium]|jgi:hypothetical protein